MRYVASIQELIDELGGPSAAAKALSTTPQNIVNWRAAGKIPARFHRAHQTLLSGLGVKASDDLWGFVDVEELTAGGAT